MADKINKVNYSTSESSIVKDPGLVSGYVDRVPDAMEKISDTITNDPLISVVSKVWYFKLIGDSKISSDTIAHSGITNKWFTYNSLVLG
jgi:hypothetical protein